VSVAPPRSGAGAATHRDTWTVRVREAAVEALPPEKLLPDGQPTYVASWIYVFGSPRSPSHVDGLASIGRGRVAERMNAPVSKAVVRLIGVPRVRISPPPLQHEIECRHAVSARSAPEDEVDQPSAGRDWKALVWDACYPMRVALEGRHCHGEWRLRLDPTERPSPSLAGVTR
jgi:hypothetical protein